MHNSISRNDFQKSTETKQDYLCGLSIVEIRLSYIVFTSSYYYICGLSIVEIRLCYLVFTSSYLRRKIKANMQYSFLAL